MFPKNVFQLTFALLILNFSKKKLKYTCIDGIGAGGALKPLLGAMTYNVDVMA